MTRDMPKRLTPPAKPGELLKRYDVAAPRRAKAEGERKAKNGKRNPALLPVAIVTITSVVALRAIMC